MNPAAAHELGLYLAAHPVAFALGAACRLRGPVVRVPGVGVVVTGADVARSVLGDPGRFTKSGPGSAGALITQVMGPYALLNMEGAEHAELRDRLRGLFTPAAVAGLAEDVLGHGLGRAAARLSAGEAVDLVGVAAAVTGRLTCRLLGVPLPADPVAADRVAAATTALGSRLTRVVSLRRRRLDPAQVARARAVYAELTRHVPAAFAAGGEDTVLGRLRGLGLDLEQARGVAGMLFLVGTGTIATALPRTVALVVDSGLWPGLQAGEHPVEALVDEALRVITPSPVMLRGAAGATRLAGSGVTVRPGERVVLFTYHLVRDGVAPAGFVPGRPLPAAVRQLWFGGGVHRCLGAALARRVLALALERLAALDGDVVVAGRRAARGVLLPAYARLDARLDARLTGVTALRAVPAMASTA